jgi:hypothetical protein
MMGSAVTFVTALADLLLSDKQKAWLTDWSLSVWNWVDEAKDVDIFAKFQSPKVQARIQNIALFVSVAVLNYFAFIVWSPLWLYNFWPNQETPAPYVYFAVPNIVSNVALYALWLVNWRVFPRIISYLANSKNTFIYVAKLTMLNVAGGLVVGVIPALLGNIVLGTIVASPAMILWLPVLGFSIFVYAVALLICLTYVLLYPLEFIIRRIVEYPKGPILAVSALFTALGAFLKVLSS